MTAPPTLQRHQGGTTLVIALIFLVILTLFAVSGVNTGIANLRTANSAQMIVEAEYAAQQQVEQILNSAGNFTTVVTPPAVNVDVNGDTINDFNVVTEKPRCMSTRTAEGYEYELATSAPKDTVWQVVATATDLVFGATVTLRQGVKIRLPVGSACVNP